MRTRAERFDGLVLDAVERLERAWEEQLAGVEFGVEDVPPPAPPQAAEPVALGRWFPRTDEHPARVVLYRRPIEARAPEDRELARLVHEVVVEQVADLLGLEPGTVDPDYGEPED